jgi:cytidylate kinase
LVIAIDGPSGSGKSSASRGVATRLRLRYLDTGAMYRAATWSAMAAGIELTDVDAVAEHVRHLDLRIGTDPTAPTFAVGETTVDDAIREPRISATVSAIATNLAVRAELIARQRAVIERARVDGAGIVAEGRDITTVVAPDADVRVLLTASEDARLARRDAQLGSGTVDESDLRDQVLRRDRDDATVSSFHEAADGVVHVDSTHLDLDQVVDVICGLAQRVKSGSRA